MNGKYEVHKLTQFTARFFQENNSFLSLSKKRRVQIKASASSES